MKLMKKTVWFALLTVAVFTVAAPQEPAATRAVGTVKTIAGNSITLKTDAGADLIVVVAEAARIVRVAPDHPDLKTAVPAQLQELQAGDRILVRGIASADGKTLTATGIVLMKAEDLAQRRERERQDWEKRGIGGLVSAVDPGAGTVQIKTTGFAGSRTVTVRTSKDTIVRRYAPDSPKFDDAVRATLDQVKAGDQLRARGTRNADGSELAAEEIVAGTFRNIAGVVISTDAANNTITLTDLATKKPVTVKITGDSQLRKMPEMLAQRLAFMLKGPAAEGGERPREGGEHATPVAGQAPAGAGPRPGGFTRNGNGAPDLHQMLLRMPAVAVADLQKGEALMIVATAPQGSSPSVITLLAGVEPILAASPNDGRAAMLLSPWNLGGGGAAGEGGPPN